MNNAGILSSPKAIAGYKLASLPFEFKRRTRFRAGDQNEGGPQLYCWLGRDNEENRDRKRQAQTSTSLDQYGRSKPCRTRNAGHDK
jgi:hypothetical protein